MRNLILVALIAMCASTGVRAADLAEVPPDVPLAPAEKNWDVTIQPYLWAAALTGTSKPFARLPPVDVDMRFKDILEDLKFAGMIAGSAHYGRFGVAGDLQYVALKSNASVPGTAFSGAQLKTDSFIGTLLGDYQVLKNERGVLYASAGARLYWASTKVTLTPGVLPGVSGTGEDVWADPMLAVRGTFNITPKIFVNGWGMIGGFGVGSDIAADLFGGGGYRFTDNVAVNIGYRYLRVDRDTGGFVYDVEQHGAMAGLVISF